MKIQIAIASICLLIAATSRAQQLEISSYVPLPPLGTAMESAAQKQYRREVAEEKAMSKIETFNLFAVAMATARADTMLADKSSSWVIERGEAFPFLGFDGTMAFVRVGSTYMAVPKSSVIVVPLSEHPELAKVYASIMAQYRIDLADDRKQAALDETTDRLRRIEEQQRRMFLLQQQQLLQLRSEQDMLRAQQGYLRGR